jgi:hypothetical protein
MLKYQGDPDLEDKGIWKREQLKDLRASWSCDVVCCSAWRSQPPRCIQIWSKPGDFPLPGWSNVVSPLIELHFWRVYIARFWWNKGWFTTGFATLFEFCLALSENMLPQTYTYIYNWWLIIMFASNKTILRSIPFSDKLPNIISSWLHYIPVYIPWISHHILILDGSWW